MRHWHAVEFLKAGWGSIYDLKQRLGHASLTTTEIYLSGEFLTEEEKIEAKYGARLDARGCVMALQLGALRDALLDAGASQEKADKAAEELAAYENRLAGIETRLAVLTWMIGFNLVMTLAILWRVFAQTGGRS